MKKGIKNNYKFIIGIIVGLIVSVVVVCAETSSVINSTDVSYNSTSTVQKAIDELYSKADIRKRKNFIYAYKYDQANSVTKCITGDESTCVPTECYKSGQNNCPAGTIVNYKVNDSDTVRFHVIKDDGSKLTMQSQKNTIYNIFWNTDSNKTEGPKTILNALESATIGWENVNTLNYTIGNSGLGYSGCDFSSLDCSTSTYTLSKSGVRARMITVQEAKELNCKFDTVKSCQIWMYNYLNDSTNYGGTNNDTNVAALSPSPYVKIINYGYWTMSTTPSTNPDPYNIRGSGKIVPSADCAGLNLFGARAVVEVNKE